MGDGGPSSDPGGPRIGTELAPQKTAPFTDAIRQPQGLPVIDYQTPDPSQPQHAFSSQLDMTQAATTHRQASGTAPYHIGQVASALPQVYHYPQGQYPAAPHKYGPQSPISMPHMSHIPHMPHIMQYGQGGAHVPGQVYYMHQHPQMPQQFYHGQVPPPHQQQQQSAMSPRMHMPYYQHHIVVGQAPGYYYPPPSHFTSQSQQIPGHIITQQYNTVAHAPFDQRAVVSPGAGERDGASAVADTGDKKSVVRGPPRKPRQSGHAVWIGNLPPQTDLMSLVHHVCKEAPGLESLFLISKSNCAFANFKDEETCMAAQQKIHDSNFQTVRLVSRLRKSTVEGAAGVTAPTGPSSSGTSQHHVETTPPMSTSSSGKTSPTIVQTLIRKPSVGVDGAEAKERFFVLKSLTVEDLELSVRTGIWATQSHNEQTLSNAFKAADYVYLIFSANKSGEYFGYARMTSPINNDPNAAIEFAPKAQTANQVDLPKAIPTEATEFAPKGRIIDDSARGTIFWETDRDGQGPGDLIPDEDYVASEDVVGVLEDELQEETAKTWGKPFSLEWISTTRLPFYRTRGLRNPWNSNREVKIARDGTELEPSVGKKLVALFFNWTAAPGQGGIGPVMTGYPPMPQGQ